MQMPPLVQKWSQICSTSKHKKVRIFGGKAGGIVQNLRVGNFDAYETMREFWIKVLNYVNSMLVKDIFKQIKIFYYWRGSVALMDPPCQKHGEGERTK